MSPDRPAYDVRHDSRMRVVVIVNGPPASGKSTLARPLADALGLPLIAKDAVKETLLDALGYGDREASRRIGAAAGEVCWTVLGSCPDGAVVESWLAPHSRDVVSAGLARAAVDRLVEVWCSCPPEEVRRRYEQRAHLRHPGHFDVDNLSGFDQVLTTAAPLTLGPVIEVRTDRLVELDRVVLAIRSALSAPVSETGPVARLPPGAR